MKNNLISFRFSDDVLKIIECYEGTNLNDKFEKLVCFCFFEVEKREERIAQLDLYIADKMAYLSELNRLSELCSSFEIDLNHIKYDIDLAAKKAEQISVHRGINL